MTAPTDSLAISSTFLFTTDPESSLAFYRDILGFAVHTDVVNGDFRWLTLTSPTQPQQELVLTQPGSIPGTTEDDLSALNSLLAKGMLGSLILTCDDVDALFEHAQAAGAEVLSEPADQFYGVRDCAFRDPSGTMVRVNQPLAQQQTQH